MIYIKSLPIIIIVHTTDDDARAELHEMLVPAALRAPWTSIGTSTCFSSYYIDISPNPADRIYRRFGLYVKYPLPEKAAKMKLDLSLARGRMVGTELVPSGLAIFDKDQVNSIIPLLNYSACLLGLKV